MNSSRKKSWTWLKTWLSCTALANEIRVPLSVILLLIIGKTEKKGTAAVMIKSCSFWRQALMARGHGHNHECHPASLSYYFLFAEIWKHYTIRQELKWSEDHREHTVSAVFFSHPATTLTNPSCSGAHYGLPFLWPEVFWGFFTFWVHNLGYGHCELGFECSQNADDLQINIVFEFPLFGHTLVLMCCSHYVDTE